jgi:EAL domain-containing protein (putative c-di-GMP-specific phosphodiesterase class I)
VSAILTFRASEITNGGPRRPVGDWRAALHEVCEDPSLLTTVFQPVVDLRRGVVSGYEALARFTAPPVAAPDRWFAAAARLGLAGPVEALSIRTALEQRRRLDAGHFLSVNVSADALPRPEVQEALLEEDSLEGVMIELTEQAGAVDYERLREAIAPLRAAGAALAVDDAGSGYATLHRIMTLRPDVVKVDRTIVAEIHEDPAKRAAVEVMTVLASRIGASVVAEGIERMEELDDVIRLGVSLGQGYALAPPAPAIVQLERALTAHILVQAASTAGCEHLAGLLARPPAVAEGCDERFLAQLFARDPNLQHVPVIDTRRHAVALVEREGFLSGRPPLPRPMQVPLDAGVHTVARRAMTRPRPRRFEPVVCCDEIGRYAGLVHFERLVEQLSG